MERRDFLGIAAGVSTMALADNARALDFYPTPSDKKVAVIFSTWCGNSRDAAVWISEGMGGIAKVFDVRENPDLTSFDHIIVGGSIRSGVTRKDMQDYIAKNKATLKGKVRDCLRYAAMEKSRSVPLKRRPISIITWLS
jgi:hypothetical protein